MLREASSLHWTAAAVGLAAAVTAGLLYPSLRPSAQTLLIGALAIVSRGVLAGLWRGPTRFRVAATIVVAITFAGFGTVHTLSAVHLSWWLLVIGSAFLLLGLVPTFADLQESRDRPTGTTGSNAAAAPRRKAGRP